MPNGRVTYHLEDSDGERSYGERFSVRLRHAALTNGGKAFAASGQLLVEPGDRVALQLQATNPSEMPLPEGASVGLAGGPLVQFEEATAVRLTAGLASGGTQDVAGLTFTVPHPPAPSRNGRHVLKGTVEPFVRLDPVGLIPEATRPTLFEATYPVESHGLRNDATSRGPTPADVSWKITNLSNQRLGARYGRPLGASVRCEGGVPPEQVFFIDGRSRGRNALHAPSLSAIDALEPGETIEFHGQIDFEADVPRDASARLVAGLHLGREGTSPVTIQEHEFVVQHAQPYAPDPDAGLLLVTHANTRPEELEAWHTLAGELGTKLVEWNRSLYGAVSLTGQIEGHDLARDLAKRCAIFLDDAGPGPLPDGEMMQAAAETGMSSLIVSPKEKRLEPVLTLGAQSTAFAVTRFDSPKEFLRADAERRTDVSGRELGRATVALPADARRAEAAAAQLDLELRRRHPERRFEVVLDAPPESGKRTVQIRRGTDYTTRAAVHLRGAAMNPREHVLDDRTRYALAKALPFGEKLRFLAGTEHPGNAMRRPLLAAILSDLIEEQRTLRDPTPWHPGLDRGAVAERLPRLSALVEGLAPAQPGTEAWAGSVHLAASLRAALRTADQKRDRLPLRRNQVVSAVSRALLDQLEAKVFAADRPAARKEIEAKKAELRRAWKDTTKDKLERMKLEPLLHPSDFARGVTTDFDFVRGGAA